LTLEDDVTAEIQREVRRSGRSFKAVVNDALRHGLERPSEPTPFQVTPYEMHRRAGFDIDDIEGLLDRLDGAARR
jgi:hypothetical protein